MKFIFISSAKNFGGGERYLSLICNQLQKRDINVYIYTGSSYIQPQLAKYHISSINLDQDDIIFYNGIGSLFRHYFSFKSHSKKVFIQHSSLDDQQGFFLRKIIRKALVNFLLKDFSLIIRVAKSCFPDRLFENIETVYNGVPPPNFCKVKLPKLFYNLGMIGSLNNNKNQLFAIDLLKNLPSNICLVIAGDGPLRHKISNYIKLNNLDSRVKLLGFSSNPYEVLLECDILLLPSKFEAFPFVILEAMFCGIPVIANDVGGISELIEHHKDGFISKNKSYDDYTRFINLLISNNRLYNEISISAINKISKYYTDEVMAENLLNSLKKYKLYC